MHMLFFFAFRSSSVWRKTSGRWRSSYPLSACLTMIAWIHIIQRHLFDLCNYFDFCPHQVLQSLPSRWRHHLALSRNTGGSERRVPSGCFHFTRVFQWRRRLSWEGVPEISDRPRLGRGCPHRTHICIMNRPLTAFSMDLHNLVSLCFALTSIFKTKIIELILYFSCAWSVFFFF